jgi:hypothetical protein
MTEVVNVLMGISLALMILAAGAWYRLTQGPGLWRIYRPGAASARKTEAASKLLMLAVISSTLAAGLAIAQWFSA